MMKVFKLTLVALFLLCSLSPIEAKSKEGSGGLLAWFKSMEKEIADKTKIFYKWFGNSLRSDKINLASKCDYNDPNKIQVRTGNHS